jgi:hypothetical protein
LAIPWTAARQKNGALALTGLVLHNEGGGILAREAQQPAQRERAET